MTGMHDHQGGSPKKKKKRKEKTHHVDVPLIPENLNLVLIQAGEAEHANLGGNVFPAARGATLLQLLAQTTTHFLNPSTHGPQILLPLGKELGVVENLAGDPRTIRGRIGDLRALQDRQLTGDVLNRRGGIRTRGGDKVEGTRSLTIQTKVLGKGLGDAELKALLDKVANRPGIANQVTRGEALVGGVEEGELVALAHHRCDLLPLLLRGVHAGGVVCAGMQQDDGTGRRCLQRTDHAIKVEALGLGGEVWVRGNGETNVGEDLVVIGPGRVGQVDGRLGLRRVEFGEEKTAQVNGASA